MNEALKLIAFDFVFVLIATVLAGSIMALFVGFDNVSWFWAFIGACIGRTFSILFVRRAL